MTLSPRQLVDLDTPALLLDLDRLERNIAAMQSFADWAGVALRPHCKTHKSPAIGRRQLEAGAIGLTCQKLGEAEVMADAGLGPLLIANQIVGRIKIDRLVALARRADVTVAVDDARNIMDLSAAGVTAGLRLKLLIEVDTGMGRCGVLPGPDVDKLVDAILASPGVEFAGLMGYEGHAVMVMDPVERRRVAAEALGRLVQTAERLRNRGIPVPVVSSTGTGTYDSGGGFPGITEIQVGSYATMDGRYRQVGVPFETALTVLAAVISTPRPDFAVTDAGLKTISTDFGLPEVLWIPGAEVKGLSEENGKIALPRDVQLCLGDKIELLPMHGCTTINLHDCYYVHRAGVVEDVWPILARGKSQ